MLDPIEVEEQLKEERKQREELVTIYELSKIEDKIEKNKKEIESCEKAIERLEDEKEEVLNEGVDMSNYSTNDLEYIKKQVISLNK